jgi:hypothetical protein
MQQRTFLKISPSLFKCDFALLSRSDSSLVSLLLTAHLFLIHQIFIKESFVMIAYRVHMKCASLEIICKLQNKRKIKITLIRINVHMCPTKNMSSAFKVFIEMSHYILGKI